MSQQRHLEYEKRFQLSNEQIEKLKELGTLKAKVTTVDEMWDNPSDSTDQNGLCLRRRNGNWELKAELPGHNDMMACREEIEDPIEIAKRMSRDENASNLEQTLEKMGVVHLGTAVGEREIYKCGEFTLDFSNFTFKDTPTPLEPYRNIMEVEIVLASEHEGNPEAKIRAFADEHGLSWERVRGKFSYMMRGIKNAQAEMK